MKTVLAFTCCVAVMSGLADAEDGQKYAKMAPVDEYLMDRKAEIALARSAAPESISDEATVYVMSRRKYEVAEQGANGFACLVGRSWDSNFGHPEFWNPRIRGAICFNPQAAATVVPEIMRRAERVLSGLSKKEVMADMLAGYRSGELKLPATGSMSYMMSKGHYLEDGDPKFHPHLMFYTPSSISSAAWGSDLEGSPVMMRPNQLPGGGLEPYNIFMVPVALWSDGTPDSPQH